MSTSGGVPPFFSMSSTTCGRLSSQVNHARSGGVRRQARRRKSKRPAAGGGRTARATVWVPPLATCAPGLTGEEHAGLLVLLQIVGGQPLDHAARRKDVGLQLLMGCIGATDEQPNAATVESRAPVTAQQEAAATPRTCTPPPPPAAPPKPLAPGAPPSLPGLAPGAAPPRLPADRPVAGT